MKLKFETSNLSSAEISGLIALLETLLPDNFSEQVPDQSTPAAGSSHMAIIGAGMERREVEAAGLALIGAAGPDQPATTRKRRTKAEIAADEAKASSAPAEAKQTASEPATVSTATPEPTTAASFIPKPIDADTLRSLLNSHIQKHSMEEAITILQSFGCNRVTEALALEPTKLAELASKLDG